MIRGPHSIALFVAHHAAFHELTDPVSHGPTGKDVIDAPIGLENRRRVGIAV